ncbi:hypothetical protein EON79_19750, partial [bacterium]
MLGSFAAAGLGLFVRSLGVAAEDVGAEKGAAVPVCAVPEEGASEFTSPKGARVPGSCGLNAEAEDIEAVGTGAGEVVAAEDESGDGAGDAEEAEGAGSEADAASSVDPQPTMARTDQRSVAVTRGERVCFIGFLPIPTGLRISGKGCMAAGRAVQFVQRQAEEVLVPLQADWVL